MNCKKRKAKSTLMSEGFESQYSIHQAAYCSDSYFFFTLIKENFFFSKNQFSVPKAIFPWQSKVIIFQRPIFNCQKKVFFFFLSPNNVREVFLLLSFAVIRSSWTEEKTFVITNFSIISNLSIFPFEKVAPH